MVPTIVLTLALVILVWVIYSDSYFAGLAIRRAIKQFASLIPGGVYQNFSPWKPRVHGALEGYDIQFGASIFHPKGGGLEIYLFEKIKLKHPPQLKLTEKYYLRLYVCHENLSIEWDWLTKRHYITPSNQSENNPQTGLTFKLRQESPYTPSEIALRATQMLKESTFNNIKRLSEIATQIDCGSVDISSQISENKITARRDFFIIIGLALSVGALLLLIFWNSRISSKMLSIFGI